MKYIVLMAALAFAGCVSNGNCASKAGCKTEKAAKKDCKTRKAAKKEGCKTGCKTEKAS